MPLLEGTLLPSFALRPASVRRGGALGREVVCHSHRTEQWALSVGGGYVYIWRDTYAPSCRLHPAESPTFLMQMVGWCLIIPLRLACAVRVRERFFLTFTLFINAATRESVTVQMDVTARVCALYIC